jgi:hypothetical protein
MGGAARYAAAAAAAAHPAHEALIEIKTGLV